MKDIIQVAGIIDAAEAEMLIDCGVTHLGFPLRAADVDEPMPGVRESMPDSGSDVGTCWRWSAPPPRSTRNRP